MVDLRAQYEAIKGDIDTNIQEVIDTCQFVGGGAVRSFTDALRTYLDGAHVIPCANGTDALQIAMMALDMKPGDEVITTSFTFFATAEVIALLGLTPVFVDVDDRDFNMDVVHLESVITEKTKCILPVHLFGQPCNMNAIMDIARRHDIYVIEDAAQSIGARVEVDGDRPMSGTIGDIGTTSFFPSKNLGCYGDGGAVFTKNETLAHKCKLIANHGMSKRYHHDCIGLNSRLDGIQAAVLGTKLPHLEKYIVRRRLAADRYDDLFKECANIATPLRRSYAHHVFHQYTIRLTQRDRVVEALQKEQIPYAIYYPIPIHKQLAFKGKVLSEPDVPITDMLCHEVLSLPMHTELDLEQQQFIAQTVIDALET